MAATKDASAGGTRVLLLGVEPMRSESLAGILRSNGFPVDLVAGGKDALDCVRREDYLVVVAGLRPEGLPGLEFLREAKGLRPGLLVVMIAEKGEVEEAIESIRRGAWDFLRAPSTPRTCSPSSVAPRICAAPTEARMRRCAEL